MLSYLRCWTTGWGKDAFGEYGKYQNILKEVDVPVINKYQCVAQLRHTRLGPSYNLSPGMLCAGGEEGKDACKVKINTASYIELNLIIFSLYLGRRRWSSCL